jgi:subtilisin family serine protease
MEKRDNEHIILLGLVLVAAVLFSAVDDTGYAIRNRGTITPQVEESVKETPHIIQYSQTPMRKETTSSEGRTIKLYPGAGFPKFFSGELGKVTTEESTPLDKNEYPREYISDQLFVTVKEGAITIPPGKVSPEQATFSTESLRKVIQDTINPKTIEQPFKNIDHEFLRNSFLLTGVSGDPIIFSEILFDKNIRSVQPNNIYYASKAYNQPPTVEPIPVFPNDPSFNKQWSLHNTGQTGGTIDADIDAPEAWVYKKVKQNAIIAIIDSGVDYTHPDLQANMWINQGEIPGNNIDDDFNGFKDDIYGWDFTNNDADPFDDNGHGTHIAGTIAAVTDNNVGVAGVCKNCKIMILKWMNSNGGGNTANVANSLYYAADNGADITSHSWNQGVFVDPIIKAAFDYAHGKGVVSIAAAGNAYKGTIHYPGGYETVIAVSSTDHDDIINDFSNYGSWVDVGAPGGGILSTVPTGSCINCHSSGYLLLSGTSMASPHVSGLAGLILSNKPSFSNVDVKNILRTATDDPNPLNTIYMGVGRVNAHQAVQLNTIQNADLDPSIDGAMPTGILTIPGTATGNNFNSYYLEYGSGIYPQSWTTLKRGGSPVVQGTLGFFDAQSVIGGDYTIRLRVFDSSGAVTKDTALITISDTFFITSPQEGDVYRLGDVLTLDGSTHTPGFTNYIVEWAPPSSGTFQTGGVILTNNGMQQITSGTIATWDTSIITYGAGIYTLRLTALGSQQQSEEISIYLDPALKQGWPVRVQNKQSYSGVSIIDPLIEDLNNDGIKEIYAITSHFIYGVSVDGQPLPGFPVALPSFTAFTRGSLTSADVDQDGQNEILFGASTIFPTTLKIYAIENDGSYTPGYPKSWVYNSGGPTAVDPGTPILAADIDGDTQMELVMHAFDLVVITETNGNLITSIKHLRPNFASTCGFSDPYTITDAAPAVGNFDGDTELEIVLGHQTTNCDFNPSNGDDGKLWVINKNGANVLGWPVTLPHPIGPSSPVVGDINNNGNHEIVVGTWGEGAGGIYVFDKNGNVMPGWPQATTSRFMASPSLSDLDSDGDLEIIIGDLDESTGLMIYHHDGTLFQGWQSKVLADKYSTAVIDANLDGVKNILVSAGEGELSPLVHVWDQTGNYLSPFPKITESEARAPVQVLDVDNDGKLEAIGSNVIGLLPNGTTKDYGSIYVWDLPWNANNPIITDTWPTFHHDYQRTGLES